MIDKHEVSGYDLRDYQDEALQWAMDDSHRVVCLPTGTGKTLVGCGWCCERLDATGIDRILVLEPSRFLVEQVTEYYRTQTTIPTEQLYGTTEPGERRREWADGTVVVTTPQTAVNDIEELEFDAVVVDECHHATGQHAYAQLLQQYSFDAALGLSATVPRAAEGEIRTLLGEIRRWAWQNLPDEHVPDWYGYVYDTPYPQAYDPVVETLRELRHKWSGTRLAGLPSLGLRMLSRDGAMALQNTLTRDTKMGDLMGDNVLPQLQDAPELHKLNACQEALANESFEKAVLFVNRVAIARKLENRLRGYNTVTLLGRLHGGANAQDQALAKAQAGETDVIIATAAGEEGIDLPAADLLIVWSNVVSSVRFIQRLGRIMRPDGSDGPKTAVYLATPADPESPDYEALRRGIIAASDAGLDITNINKEHIRSRSLVSRVRDAIEANPSQETSIADCLGLPQNKTKQTLREAVREAGVFYVYAVPDDLNVWRQSGNGLIDTFGLNSSTDSKVEVTDLSDAMANNFSPSRDERYYAHADDIQFLRTELSVLFDESDGRLQVDYGPSHSERGQYSSYGTVETITEKMLDNLDDADLFYTTVTAKSWNPEFSVNLNYHGSTSPDIIRTVIANAAGVKRRLRMRLG